MERKSSPRVLFPQNPALPWITDYQQACLTTYAPGTVEVYSSILRHFTRWITEQTRKRTTFHPDQLTPAAIEQYLSDLCAQGYSVSHCKRAKVVITHFCQWLVDDKAVLPHNPVRGIKVLEPSSSGMLPPRSLTPTQRVLLHALVKKDDVRGQALFSLGYWAGCRVKDMTRVLGHTHLC